MKKPNIKFVDLAIIFVYLFITVLSVCMLITVVPMGIQKLTVQSIVVIVGNYIVATILYFAFSKYSNSTVNNAIYKLEEFEKGEIRVKLPSGFLLQELNRVFKSMDKMREMLVKVVDIIKNENSNLNSVTVQLTDNISILDSTTKDILNTAENLSSGATQMAKDVEEAMYSVTEMSDMLDTVKSDIRDCKISCDDTERQLETLDTQIEVLQQNNATAKDSINRIDSKVHELTEIISQVQSISKVIEDIAGQTNLLSLNASIEAARAGDAGRGFSVVAEEIRNLAEQTAGKLKEIKEITTNASVISSEIGSLSADVIVTASNESDALSNVVNAFNKTNESIHTVIERTDEVHGQTDNIMEHKNSVVEKLTSLSAISEENDASAETVTQSIGVISEQVQNVTDMTTAMNDTVNNLTDALKYFK